MYNLTSLRTAVVAGTAALAVGGALASPAAAAKPAHAGPPMVERSPLAEDAPTFRCDGRVIEVTGGEFVFRGRMLPGGRMMGTSTGRAGEARDQDGNVYRLRVSGQFRETDGTGSGRIQAVLIGPGGEVYRVQLSFRSGPEGETLTVDGDCEVEFPDEE